MTPKLNSLAVKLGVLALSGVLIAAAGAVVWRHYSGLVDAKAELTSKAAGLEKELATERARIEGLNKVISRWEDASKAQVAALESMAKAQATSAAASRELKHVLSKHDLGALALAKPALVESRVNAGTERTLRLLERASEVQPAANPSPGTTSTSTTSANTPEP